MRYPSLADPDMSSGEARNLPVRDTVVEAIALTSEVCGLPLSNAAAEMLARDLAGFNEAAVLKALSRCRLELQGALKTSDIIVRIDDGRPDADEAWSMMPKTEMASVVWTDEMAEAWGSASPLLQSGDLPGAQAAFKEAYVRTVLRARINRKPTQWVPSLGSDVASRENVLLEAVQKKRLTETHAAQLMPQQAVSKEVSEMIAQLSLKKLH